MSATFQQIQMNYWRDTTDEEFSLSEKILYLYLMSNESVTSCGIYKISRGTILHETSMTEHGITTALEALQKRDKVFYDMDTKEIILINHIHYESNSPTFQANVKKVKTRIKSKKIIAMREAIERGVEVEVPDVPEVEKPEQKPKKEKEDKKAYGEEKNVFLTDREKDKLVARFSGKGAQIGVNLLSAYKLSSGKTYDSDYGAFLSWVKGELEKQGIYEKVPDGGKIKGPEAEKEKCPVCGYVPTGKSSSTSCGNCGFDRNSYSDSEAVAEYKKGLVDGGLAERLKIAE